MLITALDCVQKDATLQIYSIRQVYYKFIALNSAKSIFPNTPFEERPRGPVRPPSLLSLCRVHPRCSSSNFSVWKVEKCATNRRCRTKRDTMFWCSWLLCCSHSVKVINAKSVPGGAPAPRTCHSREDSPVKRNARAITWSRHWVTFIGVAIGFLPALRSTATWKRLIGEYRAVDSNSVRSISKSPGGHGTWTDVDTYLEILNGTTCVFFVLKSDKFCWMTWM